MRGNTIDLKEKADYKYQISTKKHGWWIFSWHSTKHEKEFVRKEELATVGLKYNEKDDITENDIRDEHGLDLRGAY